MHKLNFGPPPEFKGYTMTVKMKTRMTSLDIYNEVEIQPRIGGFLGILPYVTCGFIMYIVHWWIPRQ